MSATSFNTKYQRIINGGRTPSSDEITELTIALNDLLAETWIDLPPKIERGDVINSVVEHFLRLLADNELNVNSAPSAYFRRMATNVIRDMVKSADYKVSSFDGNGTYRTSSTLHDHGEERGAEVPA